MVMLFHVDIKIGRKIPKSLLNLINRRLTYNHGKIAINDDNTNSSLTFVSPPSSVLHSLQIVLGSNAQLRVWFCISAPGDISNM